MDFEDQVGQKTVRYVTPIHGYDGYNFGVEFEDFDEMLYQHKLSTLPDDLRGARERELDYEMDVASDLEGYYSLGRRRSNIDPLYGSMRIYHISGQSPEVLVDGDAWECEVVKCYANPAAPKTRDNRTKIHFSLRPIRRLVDKTSRIDADRGVIITETVCGTNRTSTELPCEVKERFYQDQTGLWAYKVREILVDGKVYESKVVDMKTANDYMLSLGGSDARRLRRAYRELPVMTTQ